jgi:molybdopterin synthase sulfur carrier subunit
MITVRYYAGARAAAGVSEESLPAGITLADIGEGRGDHLRKVLSSASFLVNGLAWHDRAAPLPAGATVDVLPPFAGG